MPMVRSANRMFIKQSFNCAYLLDILCDIVTITKQHVRNGDESMVQKMVIMMGIQGSGKSTFYHSYLEEEYIRVNLDTLKTRHQEKLLIQK